MTDSSDSHLLPQRSGSDALHALARGAIGSLPVLGPLAGELFASLVRTPFESRLEAWMSTVERRLSRIQSKMPERYAAILQDPDFASLFMAATQAASRTHSEEKRRLLANAVESSAESASSADEQQFRFVRYLDELGASHVQLLAAFVGNLDLRDIASFSDMHAAIISAGGPERSIEEMRMLLNDLETRMLVRVSRELEEEEAAYSPEYLRTETLNSGPYVLVTEAGYSFIWYVTEKDRRDAV